MYLFQNSNVNSMRRKFLFVILSTLLIFSYTSTAQVVSIDSEVPTGDGPVIQVRKWTSQEGLLLGDQLTIFVNITNWSEYNAYNLSINEPSFNNATFNYISGYEEYEYVELGPTGSVSYEYTLEPVNEGNYSVLPTEVRYYDRNNTEYNARSHFISFFVYEETPPVDKSELWGDVFWLSTLVLSVPIALFAVNKYIWSKD